MSKNNEEIKSRRNFIFTASSVFSGIMCLPLLGGKKLKKDARNILDNIDKEKIVNSKPKKNQSVFCDSLSKDFSCFYKNQASNKRPLFKVNEVGKMMWDLCDGKNTSKNIANAVSSKYKVSIDKAYSDCNNFLLILKKKNLITV